MKVKISAIIAAMGASLISGNLHASGSGNIALGLGSMYNGLGFKFGIESKDTQKYLALGCLSISNSDSGGTEYNCGVGLGIIRTNIMSLEGDNHGAGIHIGATYNEHNNLDKTEYFVSPQYIYFVNGINNAGLNFGGSIIVGKHDNKSRLGFGAQIGYQF